MNAELTTPTQNDSRERPKLDARDRAMLRNALRLLRRQITIERFDELQRRLDGSR
jgi:hypothetical protein